MLAAMTGLLVHMVTISWTDDAQGPQSAGFARKSFTSVSHFFERCKRPVEGLKKAGHDSSYALGRG